MIIKFNMEDKNLPAQCHPITKLKKKKSVKIKNDSV